MTAPPLEAAIELRLHREHIVRYSVRTMSNALWSSLISAGAGLLGAVIGVLGALLASRRASRTAFEQVQYSVRYERKAQVMATAYDKVGIARDKLTLFRSIQFQGYSDFSSLDQGSKAFTESSDDAEAYLTRNAVWNDPEVDQQLREVLRLCKQSWGRFYRIWTGGPSSTDIERSQENLEYDIKTVNNRMEIIGHMLHQRLDLEKPQRAQ